MVKRRLHLGSPLHNATLSGKVLRCAHHGVEFALHHGRPLCTALSRFGLAYDGDRIGTDV